SAVMLKLPMTSVLLASLLLGSDALPVTPVVIVAVAVAYIVSIRLTPPPKAEPQAQAQPAAPAAVSGIHPS
ncbi:MAG TPA: hypothetical protein VMA97_03185, partial [Streptosporangiaceae bacterium]|nr:hypothetical protein [Streptosporangiaceae bacterium]